MWITPIFADRDPPERRENSVLCVRAGCTNDVNVLWSGMLAFASHSHILRIGSGSDERLIRRTQIPAPE